jgi:putative Ca2+/H+ antiporter (TMEM165/GDT1 family)
MEASTIANSNSTLSSDPNLSSMTMTSELNYDFLSGFLSSFGIIFISEIADKTFILILFFSTKISKLKLFLIASLALVGMNAIAVCLGYMIPFLLYKSLVDWLAVASFVVMGVILILEAKKMKHKTVEEKFTKYKKKHENDLVLDGASSSDSERSSAQNSRKSHTSNEKHTQELGLAENLRQPFLEKEQHKSSTNASWMLFTSIVLAEMGDRSQITAVFIAAAYDFYGVLIGSSLAHMVCILIAIYLGLWLGHYLSEKQMNFIGGILFFIFAIQILVEKCTTSSVNKEFVVTS